MLYLLEMPEWPYHSIIPSFHSISDDSKSIEVDAPSRKACVALSQHNTFYLLFALFQMIAGVLK